MKEMHLPWAQELKIKETLLKKMSQSMSVKQLELSLQEYCKMRECLKITKQDMLDLSASLIL